MRRSYEERQQKKAFKMQLINRIKDLAPAARSMIIEEILTQKHTIPYSGKTELSRATIYRWLSQFRQHADAEKALLVKVRRDRGEFRALSAAQKDALISWRFDNACRTAKDLREELAFHPETCEPLPSPATIARYLRAQGLSRRELLKGQKPQKVRLAFESEYSQQLWMGDTKGPDIYVNDPRHPGQRVLAKPIVIMDDYARYIVAAMYVITENEYAVLELFCQALLLFGIPEMLYLDRGGPYMGNILKKGANLIGCNIIHTQPGDCEAKGKIERLLRTVHERFETEMQAQGKNGTELKEFNTYLWAYISQDYHRRVHSTTGMTPEERFFILPAKSRRWLSKDALARIFLPVRTAKVSKTGLIRVNKLNYLVSDAQLWKQKVEVRHEYTEQSKVYIWYQDQYYGEAHVYTEENDFIKREELTAKINTAREISLPEIGQVPIYGRLDRQLAKHREALAGLDINTQLRQNKQQKEQLRAELLKKVNPVTKQGGDFSEDEFIYLLMRLLRKTFTSSERLAAHVLWHAVGPLDEKLVRRTVGRLLGEEYPLDNVNAFLEEIRLAILTRRDN